MNALTAIQPQLSLSDWLADLAVDALIDEADLSPKPGLVDRRGSGAHTDLHLGLMHASALALWPSFKAMAEAALQRGEIDVRHLALAVGERLRDAVEQDLHSAHAEVCAAAEAADGDPLVERVVEAVPYEHAGDAGERLVDRTHTLPVQ